MLKLEKVGNGLGVRLSQANLAELEINEETPLEVSVSGDAIVIRAVDPKRAKLLAAAEMVEADHADAFERLA